MKEATQICGIDILEARRILRRLDGPSFTLRQGSLRCELSQKDLAQLFTRFVAEGYLEPKDTLGHWIVTAKGQDLFLEESEKRSPGRKQILKRTEAQQKLDKLLERVCSLNQDPFYLYRVRRVAVFGSYLTNRNLLSDVDVAIDLVERGKWNRDRRWTLMQDRIQRVRIEGRSFSNITQEVLYPSTECFKFLKAGSRKLNLTYFGLLIQREFPFKLIYESDETDFAPDIAEPEKAHPYSFKPGLGFEIEALCPIKLEDVSFEAGMKAFVAFKQPWSPASEATIKDTDEWVLRSYAFCEQRMSTTELVDLAEIVFTEPCQQMVYHCRKAEAETYALNENCEKCGKRSWKIRLVSFPTLHCNECRSAVYFPWTPSRTRRPS